MLLDPPPPGSAVVGTGRMTLDVIVQDGCPLRAQAGGTCGNVLAILAWLGWPGHALGRIGDDDPGRRFVRDMERWGVDCSLLERDGPTPVVVHHVHEGGHSFRGRCPACGTRLPKFEPPWWLPLNRLPSASVFVFDRDSPPALQAARLYRRDGALVLWEPNYAGPEVDVGAALAVSHVLKYSAEMEADFRRTERLFLIQTCGERGLTYSVAGEHGALPASRVAVIRDAAGCGDWTTAGFLHARAHRCDHWQSLRFGVALAAWNAAFVGARGGMYAADRATFREQVTAILGGNVIDPGEGREPLLDEAGAFCPACRLG